MFSILVAEDDKTLNRMICTNRPSIRFFQLSMGRRLWKLWKRSILI